MMNLILILAFSVLLPSTMCGENVSENTSHSNNKFNSLHPTKSNSSHSLSSNVIVKREIPNEANEMPYYHIPTAIISKRSATVLNKLMFALRNSFEKSAVPIETELGSRESENYSGDASSALGRGSYMDRFPAALVERRGQKDRKIYLRCYFNAVSCFKRK